MRYDRLRVGGALGSVPNWGKSVVVQRHVIGTITVNGVTSNTAAVSPVVDANRTLLKQVGATYFGAGGLGRSNGYLSINAGGSTVTATRADGTSIWTPTYELTQYAGGVFQVPVQRGTITITDGNSSAASAALTYAVGDPYTLTLLGVTGTGLGGDLDLCASLAKTSSTVVTATRSGITGDLTVAFEIAWWVG